ncbi:TPA: FAD-dependent oxidoreductase [Streptococcus suis]|nr:FAD-dependent oxidoreductase [Streptococcus suis]
MEQYDLVVIGFGKAGKTLAGKLSAAGKKVALVEENPVMFGGTCINIGCIPTKTLFGRNSEELINLIAMAIDNKIPYTYFKTQIFTHPTMAENLNDVFSLIEN